ncbi:nicotinate-nucleotide adenylyltransferase [Rubellimicrobium sp. CFH 75288]|uniref:nicotinate-nucleotide adenylyltransferase n=1 Tax=Rubellimicrobium sp. CFH 75288 TaxID=2697034 RepID=UPI001412C6DB|nr:nicotinate-nucleotide adenylyltransferase [Rubellimicrobium sp. CFH 75288]NAZ37496.1 nicotinate-nucleotide adenylyltransferase [Rubellimicrobium sp. CFH 75288]
MSLGPGLPTARPGMAIGLLGGSFDPAHEGHLAISRAALARLGLDRVWWLVSPANPLKPGGPAPLALRLAAARRLVRDPRIVPTDLEARWGTRFTADTLARLRRRLPGVHLVWLMGSDNMLQLHRWRDWRRILGTVPVAVFARPGSRLPARFAPAARAFRHARLPAARARALARTPPPAWVFLDLPLRADSSTALRRAGRWPLPLP